MKFGERIGNLRHYALLSRRQLAGEYNEVVSSSRSVRSIAYNPEQIGPCA